MWTTLAVAGLWPPRWRRESHPELGRVGVAQEVLQSRESGVGVFLGWEVAAADLLAAHIGGVFAPHTDDVIVPTDEAHGAPQHQDRTLQASAERGVHLVVLEVDRGGRAVVLAGGPDDLGVTETADILCGYLRSEGLEPFATLPLGHLPEQVVGGIAPD